MALEHTFKTFEVYISKDEADKLRQAILDKAKANNIKIEPKIHLNALLENIRRDLINKTKNGTHKFSFMGKEANFETSELMFSITVLKELFKKSESEQIKMLSKNLDILSIYGYGVAWEESKVQNLNNLKEPIKTISIGKINENISNLKPKNSILKPLVISVYCLLVISLIYIIFQYYELKNLSSEREYKYQKAIKVYTDYYMKLTNFNPLYISSVVVPDTEMTLIRIKFGDEKISYTVFESRYKYQIISSKEGATVKSNPGVKNCEKFDESKAFGFGLRNCISGCYKNLEFVPYYKQPNTTILRIIFDKSYFISYISFDWIVIGHNWGSSGRVFINRKAIGSEPYHTFGIYPSGNMIVDETEKHYKAKVDEIAKYIDIAVYNITNENEIFINDIVVYGK